MSWRVGPFALESIIATGLLEERGAGRPKEQTEIQVLLRLQRDLAREPEGFFQKLAEATLELSRADSSGISLLDESGESFIWPAVAGPLRRFIWDGTPRGFGPCGTVLDRNHTLLMIHPERHFDYLRAITPSLEEVLLVPFHVEHRAVGTLWAVSHTVGKRFDGEDRRLLESLSAFAASAYQTLVDTDQITTYLRKPKP